MAGSRTEEILRKIDEARELYYCLIVLVGPAGSGKTTSTPPYNFLHGKIEDYNALLNFSRIREREEKV